MEDHSIALGTSQTGNTGPTWLSLFLHHSLSYHRRHRFGGRTNRTDAEEREEKTDFGRPFAQASRGLPMTCLVRQRPANGHTYPGAGWLPTHYIFVHGLTLALNASSDLLSTSDQQIPRLPRVPSIIISRVLHSHLIVRTLCWTCWVC